MTAITVAQLSLFCPQASHWIVDGIVAGQGLLPTIANISTPLRLWHFLAQIAVESDHLKVTREYASGAAYEGRIDLGNTHRGDGVRYRGRGLIQTTGRANYTDALGEIRSFYPDCPDFVADPQRLEEFPWALLSALVYWHRRGINRLADSDDVLAVTKAINGGTNGLAARTEYLAKAKAIWADASTTTSEPDEEINLPDREPVMRRVVDRDLLADLVRAVQRVVGVEPDGDMGDITFAAIQAAQRAKGASP